MKYETEKKITKLVHDDNELLTYISSNFDSFIENFNESQKKIDSRLETIELRINEFNDKFYEKELANHKTMAAIKDELHNRINTILYNILNRINTILYGILGGAGLLFSAVLMWLIEGRK